MINDQYPAQIHRYIIAAKNILNQCLIDRLGPAGCILDSYLKHRALGSRPNDCFFTLRALFHINDLKHRILGSNLKSYQSGSNK
jgi:hypothetical protein